MLLRSFGMLWLRSLVLLFLLLVVVLAGACNGPVGLDVREASWRARRSPVPENWKPFLGESGQMQLETKPGAPYSVNVNYTILDGNHVRECGRYGDRVWVKNIAANPAVRLRIGDAIYELRAEAGDGPGRDCALRQGVDRPIDVHARSVAVRRGLGLSRAAPLARGARGDRRLGPSSRKGRNRKRASALCGRRPVS